MEHTGEIGRVDILDDIMHGFLALALTLTCIDGTHRRNRPKSRIRHL
jgi:hypothetical protein